jgi:hypothetical protein
LTPPSYCIVYQEEEASVSQTGISISDIWSFTTSTLMMETETISEKLILSSKLTLLTAKEEVNTFIYIFTRRSEL